MAQKETQLKQFKEKAEKKAKSREKKKKIKMKVSGKSVFELRELKQRRK